MSTFNQSSFVKEEKNIAFAFRTEEECLQAKRKIESTYSDLKTSTAEQLLKDGYQFVLFVENKYSLNFNLVLIALVGGYGGVSRESVRI